MARAAWGRDLDPDLDPDRLSFSHAVRVIKGKMPQAAALPPGRLQGWRAALLEDGRTAARRPPVQDRR
jgi:hypothetical protein